ncbi:hypothetical protein ACVW0Z_003003 [Ewingella americana]
MDSKLLDYYNRELAYLREMGAEFAQRYPKVAGRLGMRGIEVADPYTERLMEGFALSDLARAAKNGCRVPAFLPTPAGDDCAELPRADAVDGYRRAAS